ncbi:LapA family protein [Variovorax sp. RHLX14]|uniref:LapA family protein n=1 Tax=Variovorax sp. RHLX14 TaxID=1259731 RepID=UPI003F4615A3
MKYLLWLLKAAIFFTLFAFALNNQHDATVYFFFGTNWRAPLVLVVLAAFAGGVVVGALGMLPGWWKHRSAAAAQSPAARNRSETVVAASVAPSSTTASSPTPVAITDLPAVRQHGL